MKAKISRQSSRDRSESANESKRNRSPSDDKNGSQEGRKSTKLKKMHS